MGEYYLQLGAKPDKRTAFRRLPESGFLLEALLLLRNSQDRPD